MCEITDRDVLLIDSFAERYDLCWSINIHGILPEMVGKDGCSIYCYDDSNGLLGLCFCPDDLPGNSWNMICHAMIAAGMTLVRDCLSESYVSFDPKNERQCQLALTVAGIKPTPHAAAQRHKMVTTITVARQRKAKQLLHQRTLRELALGRSGFDLTDYDPTFVPGEYRLTL